jgi:1,4-alpha-glucan branching enzyme
MIKGYFNLVLHSHLPYVIGQRDWPHGTGWLYEAAVESYLPLLNMLYDLAERNIPPRITLSLTPVLCEQLSHPLFAPGLMGYIKEKIDFARENAGEFHRYGQGHLAHLAAWWKEFYEKIGESFESRFGKNIVAAFKSLQDSGHVEIITCAATHGYLPLLGYDECVNAQIKVGVHNYKHHFGRAPAGIWLPECAYRPGYEWHFPVGKQRSETRLRKGVEEFLIQSDIQYFIIDNHMLKGGKAIGTYLSRFKALQAMWKNFIDSYEVPEEEKERSPYALHFIPGQTPPRSVAVFTRDAETSLQVWSGQWGYPGNGWYLDFHKKHHPGGHRYWRVTENKADLGDKQEYHPEKIQTVMEEQAGHFVQLIRNTLLDYHGQNDSAGVLTAPFDTELFGHWWFEGSRWIGHVLEKLSDHPDIVPATCSQFLDMNQPSQLISLPEGSWGEGGFHYIWLNDQNSWTWEKIYKAESNFISLVQQWNIQDSETARRILRQAGRELLLLESSDWQFLISTWSARDYAEERVSLHFSNFNKTCSLLEEARERGALRPESQAYLEDLEKKEGIFSDLQLDWWL